MMTGRILPVVEPSFQPHINTVENQKGGRMPAALFSEMHQVILQTAAQILRRKAVPKAMANVPRPITAPVIGTSGTGVALRSI